MYGKCWRKAVVQMGSCRHSKFSNRVYSLMKATRTVPVGPFRCLPMMSSANPLFSGVESYCSSR